MTRKPILAKHRLGPLFACFIARCLANALASLCLRSWAAAAAVRCFVLGFLIDLIHLFQILDNTRESSSEVLSGSLLFASWMAELVLSQPLHPPKPSFLLQPQLILLH